MWWGRKRLAINYLCSLMSWVESLWILLHALTIYFLEGQKNLDTKLPYFGSLKVYLHLHCMTDYQKACQHPLSCLQWLLVSCLVPLSVFVSSFPLSSLYRLHQNLHSMVESLYSTKSIIIFIYLALKGEWERKGTFPLSSLVLLGSTVICVFLILSLLSHAIATHTSVCNMWNT